MFAAVHKRAAATTNMRSRLSFSSSNSGDKLPETALPSFQTTEPDAEVVSAGILYFLDIRR
jgi:hypothetical protein